MLPSPDILNNYEHGRFVLANLAAKRAKQLREGAAALVSIDSNHPLTIALAEIASGKIRAILPDPTELATIQAKDLLISTDEVLPAEFGMLLPALEETETLLDDHDHHGEEDHDHDVAAEAHNLTDLVGVEEDEVAPVVSEDETLSLSDLAEQETLDSDSEEEL